MEVAFGKPGSQKKPNYANPTQPIESLTQIQAAFQIFIRVTLEAVKSEP